MALVKRSSKLTTQSCVSRAASIRCAGEDSEIPSTQLRFRRSLVAGTAATVVTAAVLPGLLSACYPHSHEYVLTPEFSGVLLKGGAPMPGVTVTVSHTRGDTGDYCIDPKTVAVTDDTGAFRVPPQSTMHHFSSILDVPEHGMQITSICFQAPGKRKLGALVLASTDHKVKFEMTCDWDSTSVEFVQDWIQSPYQGGICKSR